jgi:hypothetical protein
MLVLNQIEEKISFSSESVKLEPPDSIFIPSGWDTNEKLQ